MAKLVHRLQHWFEQADRLSGGWLTILRQSFIRFNEMRGLEAAASLAYFALFSLFPLTLFLVALLGFVLESDDAYMQTVIFIRTIFPFSGDLVQKNIAEVYEKRSAFGIIGLLTLLWSASGYFNTLARNINHAWPTVKLRNMVQGRLVAIGMVGALILLLLLSLLSTTIISLVPRLVVPFGGDPSMFDAPIWQAPLQLIPAFFTWLMFIALYLWVPNKDVQLRAVLPVALLVTLVWELGKWIFTIYLASGLARFEFIYGSLGTLVALMLWIYFSNLIALFGAFLVAALDSRIEQRARAGAQVDAHTGAPAGAAVSGPRPVPDTGMEPSQTPEAGPVKGLHG